MISKIREAYNTISEGWTSEQKLDNWQVFRDGWEAHESHQDKIQEHQHELTIAMQKSRGFKPFTKTFASNRYTQIVIMKRQDDKGQPEIRLYYQAEGYGTCEIAIGFKDDDDEENKLDQAFDAITPQEATRIIDGYMKFAQGIGH